MDPPSHGDHIFYPSQIQTNMNISTLSLSSDPFEDRSSSMFNHDASIRTPTDTAFTSISDSINTKGVHPSHNIITTTTSSDGNSISTRSFSSASGSSKDKKGQSSKTRRAVGRGGVGNIINTDNLEVDYVDEADILRRRKLLAQFNPRAKISNTGRGGSGNILAASTSTPYDRSKDPDDDYEKLVHLEAQKKRMHQMVSTGRGGAGNVQNHVVVDASGGVRPRSKSLGMFNATTTNGKKKTKISTPTSRPSTASTIASNASSEHYELRDYKLASSVASTPRKKFDPYARSSVNHNTNFNAPPINTTSTPPVTMTHTNGHSVGPNHRIDHNQTPTPTQPQRLAVSSAPPIKPIWKLQYQKQPQPQQQPETKHSETTAREGTHDDKKTTNKGKWWKKSKKIDNDEEYVQIEHGHTDQGRHLHAITTDNLAQREAAASRHPPPYLTPKSSVTGIPRIAMRNPQIPSHVSPESEDSRSLSPAESQILDEVRMLAESKVHKNGHFDMYDLEEILMQARQRHQTTPTAAYDRSSQPTPQPPQLPLPPPPQLQPQPQPPTAWHAPPQIRTLPKQEQHVPIREYPERIHQRRERMTNGEFNHLPASSASIQTRDHHHPHAITTTTALPPSSYPNTSSVYRVPSSTVSDGDISEYSSVTSFERDTQSVSSRSLKLSRRERQVYESPIELGPPLAMQQAANIHAQTRNLVKQRSDSAIGYYNNQVQEYNRRPDGVSELHRGQLALTAVSKPKPVVIGVGDEEGGNWSLDPVNEEDGLYFIEDEEPYSSFIDL